MKRFLLASSIVGLLTFAFKRASQRRQEWHGLNETEVREKLDQQLPGRMPEERRTAVTEKIVKTMRSRGAIVDDTDIDTDLDLDLDLDEADGASTDDTEDDVEINLDERPAEVSDDTKTTTT